MPLAAVSPYDQSIGQANGTNASFQLIKSYGEGAGTYIRTIAKPLAASVVVAIDGTQQLPGTFDIDETDGSLTFSTPPQNGSNITAGFEFDVPVRFESDELTVNLAAFTAGDIPTIALVEIMP